MVRFKSVLVAVFALVLAGGSFGASTLAQDAQSLEYLDLSWGDLLPEGEAQRIMELQQLQALQTGINHFGMEQMPQIQTFNVVEALDGERVRLGGYVLPLDFNGPQEVTRFLLVPYVGACIHVPPPPPNQLQTPGRGTPDARRQSRHLHCHS